MAQWQQYWARSSQLNLTAQSDQSGAFADLFELADKFAAGELKRDQAQAQIRAVLGRNGVGFR